ncbi:dihydroorotate dehydrogenase (quinone) [Enemella dayhoffiae]|uniref:Dihydroorotate dehydrogenase (quinone) n=1 Tax=Enemella dayhoffiae TaxID=2016507 RepID=A0A255HAF7_9ACTN|nr:quinone-dependent dihydroorotate dehydrogenase [Enemella dayhoffiae]OYO24276.1 dihydroorotate dehydrogenase (quinone) [Enemella dayhoffiae]
MNDPRIQLLETGFQRLLRPALFATGGGDPEVAHERTLDAVARLARIRPLRNLVSGLHPKATHGIQLAGINFPGPVGLAAGLDKFAVGVPAWGALGFSHVELGTVTAKPQPGNEKPRLFRAVRSRGIINRMGFNNPGAATMAATLHGSGVRRGNRVAGIPIGISLGKSKVTPLEDAVEDYLTSFELLAPYADYIAVNVSSPNTPGLRSLQDGDALAELIGALTDRAAGGVPIFVKVAPDLTFDALEDVLAACTARGAGGLIATNTTLSRDGLVGKDRDLADEAGGLSGAPLTRRAREVVGWLAERTDLPIIGVGGIMTVDDARAMLDAGARMLQLYSGYIYSGPALVSRINLMGER